MRVAVTGGTGVVGSAVVRHLVEDGHEVRVLVRSADAAQAVSEQGAEALMGNLIDPASLDRLVTGCDWVFNVAGVNELCPLHPELLWKVNVEGARQVLAACQRAGVGRLIHTSSAVTIGEREGEVGDESTVHRGYYLSVYERTKVEAEAAILSGRGGLDVVVVNPSSVQGPGRATGTGQLLLAAAGGRIPFVVDFTFSVVDIDDCARGHLLAARQGVTGERYILSGGTLSGLEALTLLNSLTGHKRHYRFLRRGVLKGVGALVGPAFRLAGRQPPVCSESVRVLLHGHRYNASKSVRELGLEYTPVEETFRRTVQWFQEQGLLDQP